MSGQTQVQQQQEQQEQQQQQQQQQPQQQPPQQQGYGGYPQPSQPGQQPIQQVQQPVYQQPMYVGASPGYGQPMLGGMMGRQPMYVGAQPGYGHPMAGGMMAAGQPMQMAPAATPMPRPAPVPGCPPGLEYLTQIDQLLVHQQVEMFEMFSNLEVCNKYQIKNTQGQQVYFAGEESEHLQRQCCGGSRAFTIHVTDNMGKDVIKVTREFKCCPAFCPGCANCCACSGCCAQEVTIEAPPGEVIGTVRQSVSCLVPKYDILDASETPILKVEGPACICQGPCCTADHEFMVTSPDGEQVGTISKQWSGYMKEMFTQADNFGVSFPMDLDVKMKAVMIGAVFLIDFMFFEKKKNPGHYTI